MANGVLDQIELPDGRTFDLEDNKSGYVTQTDMQSAIATAVSGVTKYSIGLDQVDNTSDMDKPVSTAQQTALNAKADKSELNSKADKSELNTKADKSELNTKEDKPIVVRGTLNAGSTTLTLTNSSITTSMCVDVYTSVFGISPDSVVVAAGSVTITFPAQASAIDVKVKLSN